MQGPQKGPLPGHPEGIVNTLGPWYHAERYGKTL